MSRLSGDEGCFNRFQIPHFSNENDVRILPQDVAEGSAKTFCIGINLPLIDDAFFMTMEEFDRVLNGHNMTALFRM